MNNAITAELLETSADGYALAACALLESTAGDYSRNTNEDHGLWLTHFKQRLLELAAAVRLNEPHLFVARVSWLRRASAARGNGLDALRTALDCLRRALIRELPEALRDEAVAPIALALSSLSSDSVQIPGALDATTVTGRLGLEYIAACLEGRTDDAKTLILSAAADRNDAMELYKQVLVPVQKEIGQLWHAGDVGIADERLVSETTRELMALLVAQYAPSKIAGRSILAAAVPGNAHDLGLHMVADMFQLAGWRCLFLGANVPTGEIAQAAIDHEVNVVLLSATLTTQLKALEATILALKSANTQTRILVGGLALEGTEQLWRKLGADAYAADLESAVPAGEKLIAE
jgi:methanogenic corrinoid protein MtbC1